MSHEVKAWALTEALANKTSLVSLNGAISIALHLENPSKPMALRPAGKSASFPGPILRMGPYLSSAALVHLRCIRAHHACL